MFTNGVNVVGGLNTDSLVVNGVSISSGGASGVSIATNINDNSATNVPCTQITYQLKTKNDNQDTTLNNHDTTLTSHTTSITALNGALDALYGGSVGAWIGVTGASFLINSGAMPKAGGTFTGDVAHGTNSITSVKDVKYSNALIGSNVYCGNVFAVSYTGDGSKLTNLDVSLSSSLGSGVGAGTTVVGKSGSLTHLPGIINTDLTFNGGLTKSIYNTKDVCYANAIIGSNVYCGNVFATTYYGDGSKLSGVAGSTDCTNVLNFGTVPTTGTVNVGTAMTSGLVKIGNTTATGPQVVITGGVNGVSIAGGATTAVSVNSTNGINIGTSADVPINIGKAGATSALTLRGGSLNTTLQHSISTGSTHSSSTIGLMQTCIIPLSSEQGPISTSSGSGILPTVMFRVPFTWNIYGTRLSCLGASTSGSVTVDIQSFPQSTAISSSTVNSLTGTSIFQAQKLGIYVNNYSSVGSGILNNGLQTTTPVNVSDDSIVGIFITSAGTNVLGLKLCIYYTVAP